jgi:hypothetical protein
MSSGWLLALDGHVGDEDKGDRLGLAKIGVHPYGLGTRFSQGRADEHARERLGLALPRHIDMSQEKFPDADSIVYMTLVEWLYVAYLISRNKHGYERARVPPSVASIDKWGALVAQLRGADVLFSGVRYGAEQGPPTPALAEYLLQEIHGRGSAYNQVYDMLVADALEGRMDTCQLRALFPLVARMERVPPEGPENPSTAGDVSRRAGRLLDELETAPVFADGVGMFRHRLRTLLDDMIILTHTLYALNGK